MVPARHGAADDARPDLLRLRQVRVGVAVVKRNQAVAVEAVVQSREFEKLSKL